MDNRTSIQTVRDSGFGTRFRKPRYEDYCFSNIAGTIQQALGVSPCLKTLPLDVLPDSDDYDTVILLFVDAFGWRFLERYTSEIPLPTVKNIREHGVASLLTSQFPSTTAAHVTSIHTGLPVYESGVYEWYYYEDRIKQLVSPLLFSVPGDKERNTLLNLGVKASDFLPAETLYTRLNAKGVVSHAFQFKDYSGGPYSTQVMLGAERHPYEDYRKALGEMASLVANENEKQYLFLYFDAFDSSMHRYGPNHEHSDAVAKEFFESLDEHFLSPLKGKGKNALLLITADHGMVDIDYTKTINLDDEVPEVLDWIESTPSGQKKIPAGSSRDFFLHVVEDKLDDAYQLLGSLLSGKGEVHKTEDLIAEGIFGSPHEAFLNNVGNLVLLPYQGESVFIRGKDNCFVKPFYGHHGGLTPEEMETILLALDLKNY